MNSIGFAWPWCFLLLALPCLVRLLPPVPGAALRVPSVRSMESRIGSHLVSPLGSRIVPRISAATWVALLAWLLLVAAAARPQMPGALLSQQSGRDLMLAIDVSASMATRDLQFDGKPLERLQAARNVAGSFIRQREQAGRDRVGLVVFGSQAYLHTPLSFDLHAVRAALDTAETGLAGRETALGDAIALSTKHLGTQPRDARVLILVSDGANTAGTLEPMRAAWLAQREDVRIHAIGIGASAELDEATLKGIAAQTGGLYVRATDAAAISDFFRHVDQLESAPHARSPVRRAQELYVWPLAGAFLLACALVLIRVRKVLT